MVEAPAIPSLPSLPSPMDAILSTYLKHNRTPPDTSADMRTPVNTKHKKRYNVDDLELELRGHLLFLTSSLLENTSNTTIDPTVALFLPHDGSKNGSGGVSMTDVVTYLRASLDICQYLLSLDSPPPEPSAVTSLTKIPYLLIEDALSTLPSVVTSTSSDTHSRDGNISHIPVSQQTIFTHYLEPQILSITNPQIFKSGSRLILLRVCNQLLGNLTGDLEIRGRVRLFLSRVYPLNERSGLNVLGKYNVENKTVFESEEGFGGVLEEETKEKEGYESDDSLYDIETTLTTSKKVTGGSSGSTTSPKGVMNVVDYRFYRTFWGLQSYLSNPTLILANANTNAGPNSTKPSSSSGGTGTGTHWDVFFESVQTVLDAFQGHAFDETSVRQMRERWLAGKKLTHSSIEMGTNVKNKKNLTSSPSMKNEVSAMDVDGETQSDASATNANNSRKNSNSNNNTVRHQKYLTSSQLLRLQLRDPELRGQVLTQLLIVLQFLTSPKGGVSGSSNSGGTASTPPVMTNISFRINDAQVVQSITNQIKQLQNRIEAAFYSNPPNGIEHHRALSELLTCKEPIWRRWKDDKCPPLEVTPNTQPLTITIIGGDGKPQTRPLRKVKRSRPPPPKNYNPYRKFDLATLPQISREMKESGMPAVIDDYLEEYAEALDPASGIEEEYHPKNDKVFCWRGLRLLLACEQSKYLKYTSIKPEEGKDSKGGCGIGMDGSFEGMVRRIWKEEKGIEIAEAKVEETKEDMEEDEKQDEDDGSAAGSDKNDLDNSSKSIGNDDNGDVLIDDAITPSTPTSSSSLPPSPSKKKSLKGDTSVSSLVVSDDVMSNSTTTAVKPALSKVEQMAAEAAAAMSESSPASVSQKVNDKDEEQPIQENRTTATKVEKALSKKEDENEDSKDSSRLDKSSEESTASVHEENISKESPNRNNTRKRKAGGTDNDVEETQVSSKKLAVSTGTTNRALTTLTTKKAINVSTKTKSSLDSTTNDHSKVNGENTKSKDLSSPEALSSSQTEVESEAVDTVISKADIKISSDIDSKHSLKEDSEDKSLPSAKKIVSSESQIKKEVIQSSVKVENTSTSQAVSPPSTASDSPVGDKKSSNGTVKNSSSSDKEIIDTSISKNNSKKSVVTKAPLAVTSSGKVSTAAGTGTASSSTISTTSNRSNRSTRTTTPSKMPPPPDRSNRGAAALPPPPQPSRFSRYRSIGEVSEDESVPMSTPSKSGGSGTKKLSLSKERQPNSSTSATAPSSASSSSTSGGTGKQLYNPPHLREGRERSNDRNSGSNDKNSGTTLGDTELASASNKRRSASPSHRSRESNNTNNTREIRVDIGKGGPNHGGGQQQNHHSHHHGGQQQNNHNHTTRRPQGGYHDGSVVSGGSSGGGGGNGSSAGDTGHRNSEIGNRNEDGARSWSRGSSSSRERRDWGGSSNNSNSKRDLKDDATRDSSSSRGARSFDVGKGGGRDSGSNSRNRGGGRDGGDSSERKAGRRYTHKRTRR